jgi:hypothetical protein
MTCAPAMETPVPRWNPKQASALSFRQKGFVGNEGSIMRATMGFGRGVLLWLLGIPIPIILLLALFWHH